MIFVKLINNNLLFLPVQDKIFELYCMIYIQSLNLYFKYHNVKSLISILLISVCNIHELKHPNKYAYNITIHNKFSKSITFDISIKFYKIQRTIFFNTFYYKNKQITFRNH